MKTGTVSNMPSLQRVALATRQAPQPPVQYHGTTTALVLSFTQVAPKAWKSPRQSPLRSASMYHSQYPGRHTCMRPPPRLHMQAPATPSRPVLNCLLGRCAHVSSRDQSSPLNPTIPANERLYTPLCSCPSPSPSPASPTTSRHAARSPSSADACAAVPAPSAAHPATSLRSLSSLKKQRVAMDG